MTKKIKQQKYKPGSINDLKEQLENVENKLRAEMSWFRDEIAPLKNKQRQLQNTEIFTSILLHI